MSLLVEIVAGLIVITAPASPVPVEITASSGNTVIGYRKFDGWVPYHLCFDRCKTTPGEAAVIPTGLDLRTMADLDIRVQENGKLSLQFGHLFGAGPVIWYSLPK